MIVRIDWNIGAFGVQQIAEKAGVPVHWAYALCEHGKKRSEHCRKCDFGFINDAHPYARLRSVPVMAGVTDDGESVCFISKRYEERLRRLGLLEYIERGW